jgi:nitrite reductase (NADH) large subunit
MPRRKLVVIGNGMAGVHAVEQVLKLNGGEQFEITIFGAESCGNYNRMLLPELLDGSRLEKDIYINPLPWYEDNDITLHRDSLVTEVDRASRIVFARNGTRARYDLLLIATGGRSYMPPIAGMYGENGKLRSGVFGFRSLDDVRRIIRDAQTCRSVAVIGGGLHAIEAAWGLLKRGCTVNVLHRGSHLMNPPLDSTRSDLLLSRLQAGGLRVHLGKSTNEILGGNVATGVAFSDGGSLDCDMVIVAEGTRPNVEVGVRAGLTVERAIVVDNHMRSVDDHDIYAIGECAQHRGKVYGFVAQIWQQARIFAEHVTGCNRSAAYYGSTLVTRHDVAGVDQASKSFVQLQSMLVDDLSQPSLFRDVSA